MRKFAPLILLLAIFLVAGCVQQAGNNTNTQIPADNQTNNLYQPPEGTPTLTILSPADGTVFNGSIVGIKVNVTNFRLVGIIANPVNKPNEGHIHYYLNDKLLMSPYISASFANVASGTYTLRAELVNDDHTPLTPDVSASVTVIVK